MRGGLLGRVGPVRIALRVAGDHRLAPAACGAAESGARSDAQSALGFEGGGQVRRRPVMQAKARLIEEQDGGVQAVQLGFDEARQAIEDVGQRRARRDHFEESSSIAIRPN